MNDHEEQAMLPETIAFNPLLFSEYAAYVPVSVTAETLGVEPILARGDFKRWTMDLLKAPSRNALSDEELASIRKSVQELLPALHPGIAIAGQGGVFHLPSSQTGKAE
jgi:hypothetical protein